MRRELGSVLAIAFVAATAAGCGQKNNAATAGAESTGVAQPAPESAATTSPAAAPAESAGAAATTPAAATTAQVTVPPNLPAGVTAAMIQEGRTIFTGQGNCYTCHGMDAKGTALAPDLTASKHIWVTDYPSYVKLVTAGVPQPKQHPAPMPPRGGSTITDAQVRAVAAYEWSLSHPQGGK